MNAMFLMSMPALIISERILAQMAMLYSLYLVASPATLTIALSVVRRKTMVPALSKRALQNGVVPTY